PDGKYLYGLDKQNQDYFIYNISKQIIDNLSLKFPKPVRLEEDYDEPQPPPTGLKIAGWMPADSAVIVYDKYDIWKVYPTGTTPAINLTQGYGRGHHLVLRLIGNYSGKALFIDSATYILSGSDERTRETGFYSMNCRKDKNPRVLTIGPFYYEGPYSDAIEFEWVQTKSMPDFLVRRESATQSPNYFLTKDFKVFRPLSGVFPEKGYNWLTAELVRWRTFDQSFATG